MFRRSERAKSNTKEGMSIRINELSDNIDRLELSLLNPRNWFARVAIRTNLRLRKSQLARYYRRWDRYEKDGWI